MLPGWEQYTEPLNDDEKRVAHHLGPLFIKFFKGPKNARTAKQIADYYSGRGVPMNGARVRKIIHHLRVSGAVPMLLASSKGYYRSIDINDCVRFEQSLEQRAEAITRVLHAVRSQRIQAMNGTQKQLFDGSGQHVTRMDKELKQQAAAHALQAVAWKEYALNGVHDNPLKETAARASTAGYIPSMKTLRRWAAAGELPGVRKSKSGYIVEPTYK